MIISYNKTIGTVCRVCGFVTMQEIGPFHVLGEYSIACEHCGSVVMNIKRKKDGSAYTITQECFICGQPHTVQVSHDSLWRGNLFSFGCQTSGIDMCYIGKKKEVDDALAELVESLDDIAKDVVEATSNDYVREAIEILENMLAKGKIICLCGKSKIMLTVLENELVLYCGNCHASEKINCGSDIDLAALKSRKSILLR